MRGPEHPTSRQLRCLSSNRQAGASLCLPQTLEILAVCCFNVSMTSWRGDVSTSGVAGGAVSAVIGIAAVVVAVVALSNSQRHEAFLAIGIAAVVVFVLAV